MSEQPDFNEIFSTVIRQWRTTNSQRMIFGVKMPQTKQAIVKLAENLKEVLDIFPSFSLVKKEQAMEIVVKTEGSEKDPSAMANIPANLPSLPNIFKQLNIESISIGDGVTEQELTDLFSGMSMSVEEIKELGGLKGYLQLKEIVHIDVDQIKFKLLKDGEQIGAGGGALKAKKQKVAKLAKLMDSAWKEYIGGKVTKNDFKDQNKDAIKAAAEDTKELEKTLKRMMAKQKEAEKFLAQLELKLFDIGFPTEAIEALKKKLLKPKKVTIAEDELARLRKIEQEFLKNSDGRMDSTLETIDTIKKKLSDETARSEAIMHQMGQGGVILDKNGNILTINATAQKILGLPEKDLRGKNLKEVLQPHHMMTSVSNWQDETDDHTPSEVKVHAPNDETLAVIQESAIVVENETGRSIGVVSALQSVTQQEELNRRKNDILDVLGHDLRAPLGAIKQNFNVLTQMTQINAEGNPQQKKFLENCQSSIGRMQRLIEKILDTRQLETGKILLRYDMIETKSLLEQSVTSLSDLAKNKNITLKVTTTQMRNMEGDPERLYQVITNLVTNAVKFTSEGGDIIVEGRTVQDMGKEYIKISVKDSGMGIDPENLTIIFDKYQQVTVNAPTGVRGLGLGLSICKTIVELHGGTIWAESEMEKGSTFTFQVPVMPKSENNQSQ
ncbi:MAG: PAS domain-containing sensor histidine kinase [Candidatus Omnitrophica bacterium]|nr:PAS domain-containing sensor histidine kinase [Candidatus Omnitrophota bacterium]